MNNEVKTNSGNSSIVAFIILVLPLSFFLQLYNRCTVFRCSGR